MTLKQIEGLCRQRGLRLTALGSGAWRVQGRGIDLRFRDVRAVKREDLDPPDLRAPPAYDSRRDDGKLRYPRS